MPVSGVDFETYGGLTTCYEVEIEDGRRLLIDLGTGVHHLVPTLGPQDKEFDIFFTHVHWDHTHGIPFFWPLYDADASIRFHAHPHEGLGVEEMVAALMRPPWFPVDFHETPANKHFDELSDHQRVIGGVTVRHAVLHHPSGVSAYRFETNDHAIVLATDVEPAPWSDQLLIELASGADVLIHDAQYFPDEYRESKVGWGHSTWEDSVRIAEAAGVGRLVITSHDPYRTDKGVDEIVAEAAAHLPTEAASVGMRITAG